MKNKGLELAKLFSDYIETYQKKRSQHTISGYRVSMQLFMTFLEETKGESINTVGISSFSVDNITDFMRWQSETRKVSDKTVNLRLSHLLVFMKEVAKKYPEHRSYYLEMKEIERYKVKEEQKTRKALSRKAVKAILAAPGTDTDTGLKYTAMFAFLYTTITRIDEILSIRIKDLRFDLPSPCITVVGKGKKARTVGIPRKTVSIIKKYIRRIHGDNPDPNAFLFFSPSKGLFEKATERSVNKQLEVYVIKARKTCPEVPEHVHCHQFRHSGATHMLEDGLNIYQISRLLGHESVETTKVYLSVSQNMMNKALEKAESLAAKSIKQSWKKSQKLRDYFK